MEDVELKINLYRLTEGKDLSEGCTFPEDFDDPEEITSEELFAIYTAGESFGVFLSFVPELPIGLLGIISNKDALNLGPVDKNRLPEVTFMCAGDANTVAFRNFSDAVGTC
jgi:hypothetical protein